MHVETKTARNKRAQGRRGLQPGDAGMRVPALDDRSVIAFAGMDVMTMTDWAALRDEVHQKLQDLKPSGDGYWERIKSDLEAKIAALEESIGLSAPTSENIRPALDARQRNKTTGSDEQKDSNREHLQLKKTPASSLPNLAA